MPRKNISATIEEDLIEWAKKQVKTGRFRSLSHVIEYALRQLKEALEKGE